MPMTDCHETTLSWPMGPARFPRATRLEMGQAYAVIGVPTWDDEDATCAPAHELVHIPHPRVRPVLALGRRQGAKVRDGEH
ncbi:hypothetical protein [Streptomyces sp. CA-253872]|uniref:hypothetical protein n=1 Tax=Streptomyces sp. CA-253872 TaxID=3240067 RepID=UPI003D924909